SPDHATGATLPQDRVTVLSVILVLRIGGGSAADDEKRPEGGGPTVWSGDQPNRPVTYCSVSASRGVWKRRSVGPYSTRRPRYMKAVYSLTRAACCMLWVTIRTVYRSLISPMSSSMRRVAMGSRAEQGSSRRRTS